MQYINSNGLKYSNDKININIKRGMCKRKNNRNVLKNVLLLLSIIAIISLFLNTSLGSTALTTKTISVRSGNTIWTIAEKICRKNDELNIKKVMNDIKELNNIKDNIIYEGQTLLVYDY